MKIKITTREWVYIILLLIIIVISYFVDVPYVIDITKDPNKLVSEMNKKELLWSIAVVSYIVNTITK